MLNNRIAELLVRKLSGEATEKELQELEEQLQLYPGDRYFAELFSEFWHSRHEIPSVLDLQSDDHFNRILSIAEKTSSRWQKTVHENEVSTGYKSPLHHKLVIKLSIAALFIALAISIYLFIPANNDTKQKASLISQKNEVVAKFGTKSRLLLPDSSQVWLNSGSKLIYNENFNDKIREVELEGEAFFDVVKDENRPFIVHASGIDIRVLGTVFNVKSYPKETTIETILLRGLIEVINKTEPKSPKVILRPHEKMIFHKRQNFITKIENNEKIPSSSTHKISPTIAITTLPRNIPDTSVVETSWVYNKLIFDGDTFLELAAKMERWFDVKISFKNVKVANYRFHGVFVSENIEQALKALKLTASFNYKINNNEVEIDKK